MDKLKLLLFLKNNLNNQVGILKQLLQILEQWVKLLRAAVPGKHTDGSIGAELLYEGASGAAEVIPEKRECP